MSSIGRPAAPATLVFATGYAKNDATTAVGTYYVPVVGGWPARPTNAPAPSTDAKESLRVGFPAGAITAAAAIKAITWTPSMTLTINLRCIRAGGADIDTGITFTFDASDTVGMTGLKTATASFAVEENDGLVWRVSLSTTKVFGFAATFRLEPA